MCIYGKILGEYESPLGGLDLTSLSVVQYCIADQACLGLLLVNCMRIQFPLLFHSNKASKPLLIREAK